MRRHRRPAAMPLSSRSDQDDEDDDDDSVALVLDADLMAQLRTTFGSVGAFPNNAGASAVVRVPTAFARQMHYYVVLAAEEQEREEREERERVEHTRRLCEQDEQLALEVYERALADLEEQRGELRDPTPPRPQQPQPVPTAPSLPVEDSVDDVDSTDVDPELLDLIFSSKRMSNEKDISKRLDSLFAEHDKFFNASEAAERDYDIVALVLEASRLKASGQGGSESSGPGAGASGSSGSGAGVSGSGSSGAGASGSSGSGAGASGSRGPGAGASGSSESAAGPSGSSSSGAGASGSSWLTAGTSRSRSRSVSPTQRENAFLGELGINRRKSLDEDEEDDENPWDAADPMAAYQRYREKATMFRVRRDQFRQTAQEMFQQGRRDVAGYYTSKSCECNRDFQKNNALASAALLATMSNTDTLDLHFFRVGEAVTALDLFLDHHIRTLDEADEEGEGVWLTIVTGRGVHSLNNKPVLKPAVLKRVKQRKLRFAEPKGNPGALRVYVTGDSALSHQIKEPQP